MKRGVLACVGLAVLLAGCVSTGSREGARAATVEPVDPATARAAAISGGWDASPVSWGAMVDAAAGAEVVIIGELHGHRVGLAVGAALWEDLLAREGLSPALSLEFFDRGIQAALDDYLTGVTDETKFREAAGRTAGNYPEGHRAMVETARGAGVPVYASNAPRRYTTRAREEGLGSLEALRASQRALFETPVESSGAGAAPGSVNSAAYRERFFESMGGMLASHGGDDLGEVELGERVEGYFRAQRVWDATMADTIVRALASGRTPVVHVVGRFHSDFRGGLVEAVWARRPGTRIVTLSMVEGAPSAGEDRGRADFVVEVGPAE
jgi:uncharacterized iron-regulated protein